MNRFEMMAKIAETLEPDEKITIVIAHGGKYSGADIYEIQHDGGHYIGHKWNTRQKTYHGTLRNEYRTRVLKR